MASDKIKSEITEDELIASLSSQSKEAISIIYDKYAETLYGVIYRIVQSEELANDLLQEVFIKIWQNASSYNREKGKLFTWLLNIARNTAIDKIRSKEYKNIKKNRDIENYVNINEPGSTMSFNPEHIGIKELTEKLKPEQKEILDLVYFNGYTQAEVSEALNIPLGTVKTRIKSAINILRTYFKKP